MGLPNEFLCDNAGILNSDFLTTLAELSGVEKYHSVIHRHNSNGLVESAVQGVMMALHKYFSQRGGHWYHALPMAVWGLENLPGMVAPHSPHRLVFGRDPPGFRDCPPFLSKEGSDDALDFFLRLSAERRQVQQKLERLHGDVAQRFSQTTKSLSFEEGDRVWLRDLPKAENKQFNKLKRIWQGPFEVLKWEGGNRYVIDTPQGPRVYSIDPLKPYGPALSGAKVPLYYQSDIEAPPEDDRWDVQEIFGMSGVLNPGGGVRSACSGMCTGKVLRNPPGSLLLSLCTRLLISGYSINKQHNINVDCSDAA